MRPTGFCAVERMVGDADSRFFLNIKYTVFSGVHPRGGPGVRALPLGPKKHYIFRVSSVKLCDLRLCNTCSKVFASGKDRRSL